MKHLVTVERFCLIGHSLSLAFGLAGLLLVLPSPDFIQALPTIGQSAFGWSMANGGVAYILLGAITVSIYAYRTFGLRHWLTFMLPTVFLSLGSELLGTSTGFPFGAYGYLSGLGYKIAGLVPFTIPLSWFYVGMCCYVLARAGLERLRFPGWATVLGGIALGSVLLTAWDFVLDPAMSQTPYPFWEFKEIGAFFGMPYRNLSGWFGTGAIFMTVASLFWGKAPLNLSRSQLNVPLAVYLINFAFGAIITIAQLDSRFWIPTALSICLGVVPAIALWWMAQSPAASELEVALQPTIQPTSERGTDVPPITVGLSQK
jgi:putative membrane protein